MTTGTAPTRSITTPPSGETVTLLEFEKPLARILTDIEEMLREQRASGQSLAGDIKQQRARFRSTMRRLYNGLTPWDTVMVARHPQRPLTTDYLRMIFRDFCELHGDRCFGDDKAIVSGFTRIGAHRVMLIGHNKGKDIKERIECNFGCAQPEGYRKALRMMKLAEKFQVPVVCLIDTQGAYPGIGSEERGIAQAIAVNLMEMSRLRTPIVCVVIGEGGSGGALGVGVGDRVAMFQNSFYSVISPEGCAAILWKTADRRKHAAEALHLTARELRKLNLIDDVIAEPVGGAHRNPELAGTHLEKYITSSLNHLSRLSLDSLIAKRMGRIRKLGCFFESPSETPKLVEQTPHSARRATPRTTRLSKRPIGKPRVPA